MRLVLTHTLKCEEFLNCAITTMSTHSREPRFNKISPHDRWHLRRNYIKRFYCRKIFNIYGSLYFCLVYIRKKKNYVLYVLFLDEYTNIQMYYLEVTVETLMVKQQHKGWSRTPIKKIKLFNVTTGRRKCVHVRACAVRSHHLVRLYKLTQRYFSLSFFSLNYSHRF